MLFGKKMQAELIECLKKQAIKMPIFPLFVPKSMFEAEEKNGRI
jgi:hypothetical protein